MYTLGDQNQKTQTNVENSKSEGGERGFDGHAGSFCVSRIINFQNVIFKRSMLAFQIFFKIFKRSMLV